MLLVFNMLSRPTLGPGPFMLAFVNMATATCSGGRPIALCCMSFVPWYTDSNVWGNICGCAPESEDELTGERCISVPSAGRYVHYLLLLPSVCWPHYSPTGSVGKCYADT